MSIVLALIALALIVVVYVFVVRPRIRPLPAFAPFFDRVEPWERFLWEKSRTILVGRLYWLGGLVLALHDTIGSLALDWTPLFARLLASVPDDIRPMAIGLVSGLVLAVTGWIINALRKRTDEPLEAKE